MDSCGVLVITPLHNAYTLRMIVNAVPIIIVLLISYKPFIGNTYHIETIANVSTTRDDYDDFFYRH